MICDDGVLHQHLVWLDGQHTSCDDLGITVTLDIAMLHGQVSVFQCHNTWHLVSDIFANAIQRDSAVVHGETSGYEYDSTLHVTVGSELTHALCVANFLEVVGWFLEKVSFHGGATIYHADIVDVRLLALTKLDLETRPTERYECDLATFLLWLNGDTRHFDDNLLEVVA